MSNFAIESLLKERQKLVDAKNKAIERYDFEISEFDRAITLLEGRQVKDPANLTIYDDEHPDYIKGSQEEM